MNILFITDTWKPHINGVVRSIEHTVEELEHLGHHVKVIGPGLFHTLNVPRYPELDLVFPGVSKRKLSEILDGFEPDHIHVATEGFLGMSGKRYARYYNIPMSTAYHTQFPMYLKKYFYIPERFTFSIIRRFHNPLSKPYPVMVSTNTMKEQLENKGFRHIQIRALGFDDALFYPRSRTTNQKPQLLFAGRVAIEKNIKAFLELSVHSDYDLVVVGDGPKRSEYEREYPNVTFLGYKEKEELAQVFSDADCLVFPSLTDTFGMVIIEAMACGTPVAAYPSPGPIDIIIEGVNGAIDTDLLKAVERALTVSRPTTADHAKSHYSWKESTKQFIEIIST